MTVQKGTSEHNLATLKVVVESCTLHYIGLPHKVVIECIYYITSVHYIPIFILHWYNIFQYLLYLQTIQKADTSFNVTRMAEKYRIKLIRLC